MSPSTRTFCSLATVAVAAIALTGCIGDEDAAPSPGAVASETTPSPSASPSVTPDPWAGYFDDEVAAAAPGDFLWQSWGTFGDPGGVAPFRSDNQTIDPGAYAVTIDCAGPDAVTGRISTSAGTAIGEPLLLPCQASTQVEIDLPERGLLVELDSDREPGAFLIRVSARG